jgi:hypothetical protein
VLPTSSKGQKLSGGKLSEASLAIKQTRRGWWEASGMTTYCVEEWAAVRRDCQQRAGTHGGHFSLFHAWDRRPNRRVKSKLLAVWVTDSQKGKDRRDLSSHLVQIHFTGVGTKTPRQEICPGPWGWPGTKPSWAVGSQCRKWWLWWPVCHVSGRVNCLRHFRGKPPPHTMSLPFLFYMIPDS